MTKYINKNGKEYTLDDVYCYNIYWKFIRIEFNFLDKYQVFNLSWGKALKFNWKTEFNYCDITWDYIEIQFNDWDNFQVLKLDWGEALEFDGKTEFNYCEIDWDYINIQFNEWEKFKKLKLQKVVETKIIKNKFIQDFQEQLKKMEEIMKAKNADYANSDPFSNFRLVEKLWVTTVEKWILVRMSDKMSRICNLIDKEAQVKDEAITSTLLDLANYATILSIYLKDKNWVYKEDSNFEQNI